MLGRLSGEKRLQLMRAELTQEGFCQLMSILQNSVCRIILSGTF